MSINDLDTSRVEEKPAEAGATFELWYENV